MMNRSQPISADQLAATAFVLMLSPALRLFPSAAAASAGRAAPLAALLAFSRRRSIFFSPAARSPGGARVRGCAR